MSQINIPRIKILRTIDKSSMDDPQYDKVEINCIECNKNKIQLMNYTINNFYESIEVNESKEPNEYNYQNLCCSNCRQYLADLDNYFEKENNEIESRDQTLEIEYRNNVRKTEPKSNKFVKRILRVDHNWDDNNKKHKVKNWYYVSNCEKSYPVEYHTLESITELHKNCRLCKLINGSSKATKLNDYEVIHLFRHNKRMHKVRSNNYTYERILLVDVDINKSVLYHNGNIEAIRRSDNTLIHNSQEWQSGGGMYGSGCSCPQFSNAINLPLETINNEVFKRKDSLNEDIIKNIDKIKILDQKDKSYVWNNNILFKANNKYCWFKLDESHEYLIILPMKVSNIKEANECLKPKLLENKKEKIDYTRIGDYYFIETKEDFKQYDKFQREKCDLYHSLKYYPEKYEDLFNQVKNKLIEYFPDRFKPDHEYRDQIVTSLLNSNDIETFINQDKTPIGKITRRLKINEIINIVKKVKPVSNGNLIRYDIYDSNHIADNSFYNGSAQFVKGYVYHKNKDHSRRKFVNWFMVLSNEAIRSWQVDPRKTVMRD